MFDIIRFILILPVMATDSGVNTMLSFAFAEVIVIGLLMAPVILIAEVTGKLAHSEIIRRSVLVFGFVLLLILQWFVFQQ